MPKFDTYNKLYFKGKPTGKAFRYHKGLKAKNKTSVKQTMDRINRQWNKTKGKKNYHVKFVKSVKK